MPLQLTDLHTPAAVALLNRWAQRREQTEGDHSLTIKQLLNRITILEKKAGVSPATV